MENSNENRLKKLSQLYPDTQGDSGTDFTVSMDEVTNNVSTVTTDKATISVDETVNSTSKFDIQALTESINQQNELLRTLMQQQQCIHQTLLGLMEKMTANNQSIAQPSMIPLATTTPPAPGPSSSPQSHTGQSFRQTNLFVSSTPASDERDNIVVTNNANIVSNSENAEINLSGGEARDILLALSARTLPNVEIDQPKFSGTRHEKPVMFLRKFEEYANYYNLNDSEKLKIVPACLEGSALNWILMNESRDESQWSSFSDFKSAFLKHFWSVDRQAIERSRLLHMKYNHEKKLNIVEYFMRQVNDFRMFIPPMSDDVIVFEVMIQLPANIHSLWGICRDRSLDSTLTFLQKQAELFPKKIKREGFRNKKVSDVVSPVLFSSTSSTNTLETKCELPFITNLCIPPPPINNLFSSTNSTSFDTDSTYHTPRNRPHSTVSPYNWDRGSYKRRN